MRLDLVGCVVGATVLLGCWTGAWSAAPALEHGGVEQHSEGACSPPIVNNEGLVSISCQGMDEKALRFLEAKLTEKLNELQAGFAQKFGDLSEQLIRPNDDNSAVTIGNLNDMISI